MVSDFLLVDLNLTIPTLGILSSLFYLSYTAMQIPAGLLSDQYGPRRILTIAMFACAISTLIFSDANHFYSAAYSRLLLGFGASFAYCCPLLIAKYWFPSKRFAMIGGFIQTLGAIGAMIGNEPIAVLTENFGWRNACELIGFFGIIFGALMWLIVQDRPTEHPSHQYKKMKTTDALLQVFRNRQNWIVAILGFCCWAPMTILAELWGRSYLTTSFHFNLQQSALMMTWVWLGVAMGGPLMGWLSNHMHSRKRGLLISYMACLLSTLFLIYLPLTNQFALAISLTIFGGACAGQCITFGVISDINDKKILGTAIGFNNMAVISGGIFLQPIVGFLLDYAATHQGHLDTVLTKPNFQFAFIVIPMVSIIGLVLSQFALKESLKPQP